MKKAVQKRTLETRARLLSVAKTLAEQGGYEALRVEEIVLGAGVAKGTFFAHFRDKEALLEILIGAEMHRLLDAASARKKPDSVAGIIAGLHDYHVFMSADRYTYDLILRYSGAAAVAETGPISECFERYVRLVHEWVQDGPFRRDISPMLLAEGVQAFAIQAMSLKFCALHEAQDFEDRLAVYLEAWMVPAR